MAITPKLESTPKRRRKRRKQRDPARVVRAENLFLHLQGKLEVLRYSNHPDAPTKLLKTQRVIERCRKLIHPEVAAQFEAMLA